MKLNALNCETVFIIANITAAVIILLFLSAYLYVHLPPIAKTPTAPPHLKAKQDVQVPQYLTRFLDHVWYRESRCGKDKTYRVAKPTQEVGQYQIRPIFCDEVERISGYVIDRHDNTSCRRGIQIWCEYWLPRVQVSLADTEEAYEVYRRGPTGYRNWKKGKS